MSKYVKYITNTHHGAPQLKGDRWGYCVELLRTCLVTGFNERTDLVKFEVLTPETVKFTFTTDHMYVDNQTIKISGLSFPELNTDFFILSYTAKEVTVKSYVDLTALVGQVQSVTAKSIVAPLGFIEKFKDGNRSAFTTDEEEAFFYIDDTMPSNFNNSANNQAPAPLVYMTDKMSDIDTDVGKYIFPYDDTNPTKYKLRGYSEGTYPMNGLMNFFTHLGGDVNVKTVPINYTLVGNGRMFYFIPESSTAYYNIYNFGKFEASNKIKTRYPYTLTANNTYARSAVGVYAATNVNNYKPPTNFFKIGTPYNPRNTAGVDGKNLMSGILINYNKKSASVFFTPYSGLTSSWSTMDSDSSGVNVSGCIINKTLFNPDNYNRKYYISRMVINDFYGNVGYLSGLMFVYNGNLLTSKNGTVSQYKFNNKSKFLVNINSRYKMHYNSTSTGYEIDTLYNISLDYEDWRNYE